MYKLTIIIIHILLLSVNVFSQVTLTNANSPAPGDNEFRVRADSTGITQGNSGANQVWNFTNIVRQDSASQQWFLTSATPYASYFPVSDVAGLDTCYNFFKRSPDKFEFVGYFSHGDTVHYSDYETILTYPFTYNSAFTDNFAAVIYSGGDVIYRTGTANVTGDAYGTILLPFGTYINALRLKHVISLRDTSTLYHITLHTDFTIYEWYVPGKKYSVFKIAYMTISFPGFSTTHKNVFYNPVSTPIGILPISSEVPANFSLSQNYPNPFNPNTIIKFQIANLSDAKLIVYNVLGQQVAVLVNEQLIPGTYEVSWNASNLPSGVYFYTLKAGDFIETKKMILTK